MIANASLLSCEYACSAALSVRDAKAIGHSPSATLCESTEPITYGDDIACQRLMAAYCRSGPTDVKTSTAPSLCKKPHSCENSRPIPVCFGGEGRVGIKLLLGWLQLWHWMPSSLIVWPCGCPQTATKSSTFLSLVSSLYPSTFLERLPNGPSVPAHSVL